MTRVRIALGMLYFGLYAVASFAQLTPEKVASSFLPPGTRMARLERFDGKTGRSIKSVPAVLTGHFLSPQSDDMVMAYVKTAPDPQVKSLFVTVYT